MQKLVEKLETQRRSVLSWCVVTFTIWQLAVLTEEMLPDTAAGWVTTAVSGVSIVGAVAWVISIVRLQLFARQLRANPQAAHAVLDERFQGLRREAFITGYWMLLAYFVVAALVSVAMTLPAKAVVTGGILVGVVAPLSSILWRDRADADA